MAQTVSHHLTQQKCHPPNENAFSLWSWREIRNVISSRGAWNFGMVKFTFDNKYWIQLCLCCHVYHELRWFWKKYTNGKKTPVVSVVENSISNLRQTRQKRRFSKRCHPERVGIGVHQNLTKCKTELVHVANFGRLLQSFGREDVSGRRSVN